MKLFMEHDVRALRAEISNLSARAEKAERERDAALFDCYDLRAKLEASATSAVRRSIAADASCASAEAALSAENARLREALEPFTEPDGKYPTFADILAARAALSPRAKT